MGTVRMSDLKGVGYFRELEGGDAQGPSLAESRSTAPQENEQAILRYLETSPVMMWSPTLVRDALDPETVIGDEVIHTDGVWDWRADLAHYVRRYHVRLDPAFIAHMTSRAWTPPAPQDVRIDFDLLAGADEGGTRP